MAKSKPPSGAPNAAATPAAAPQATKSRFSESVLYTLHKRKKIVLSLITHSIIYLLVFQKY